MCSSDLEILLVRLGVDGAVVCNGRLRGAFSADLDDLVGRGVVDGVDERVYNVGKDDIVARVVEEAGDEATAWREDNVSNLRNRGIQPWQPVMTQPRKWWLAALLRRERLSAAACQACHRMGCKPF